MKRQSSCPHEATVRQWRQPPTHRRRRLLEQYAGAAWFDALETRCGLTSNMRGSRHWDLRRRIDIVVASSQKLSGCRSMTASKANSMRPISANAVKPDDTSRLVTTRSTAGMMPCRLIICQVREPADAFLSGQTGLLRMRIRPQGIRVRLQFLPHELRRALELRAFELGLQVLARPSHEHSQQSSRSLRRF